MSNGQGTKEAKLFYSYSLDSGTLSAGASGSDAVTIESDSNFVLTKMAFFASDGAGAAQEHDTRIIPLVRIQLRDTGSGRNLLDGTQPIVNLFGTGEIPFILPIQQIIRANSVLRADFTSFEAAEDRQVELSLIGFKLYYYD